jgi:peptidyl-prolyl cis-trans isomerase SurA
VINFRPRAAQDDDLMSLARNMVFGLAAVMALAGVSHAQTGETNTPSADAPPSADGQPPADTTKPVRGQLGESVAAVVNDEIISTYDLRQRMLLLMVTSGVQPTEQNIAEIQKEALRGLVDEHLEMEEIRHVQQKQKDLHLEPTTKEIDEEIQGMAEQNRIQASQLLGTLKAAGVAPETLRSQLTAQMAWRHYMGGRFGSSIRIGDEQIAAAEARAMASAEKSQYLVSEIFIDASRVGGIPQANEGAQQLIAQIKQGAPFPAVARQFSGLPTAANGGDAGWLTSGDIQPSLESVLEAMRPGQLSAPVPTPEGVYILLLRDKRAGAGATVVNLKQVAVRLPTDANPEQIAAAQAKLVTLKGEFTTCSGLEAKAAKIDGAVAGDLGETDVSELSVSFKTVVEGLKVGQIGGPVRTNAGLHLIALCGRHAAGDKAPTHDDLENRLYGEQLSMVARRFLRDLRNSATIESR